MSKAAQLVAEAVGRNEVTKPVGGARRPKDVPVGKAPAPVTKGLKAEPKNKYLSLNTTDVRAFALKAARQALNGSGLEFTDGERREGERLVARLEARQ